MPVYAIVSEQDPRAWTCEYAFAQVGQPFETGGERAFPSFVFWSWRIRSWSETFLREPLMSDGIFRTLINAAVRSNFRLHRDIRCVPQLRRRWRQPLLSASQVGTITFVSQGSYVRLFNRRRLPARSAFSHNPSGEERTNTFETTMATTRQPSPRHSLRLEPA